MFATKKPAKDAQPNADLQEQEVPEFIPQACHVSPQTVITKNGELMQVIKITGFEFESVKTSGNEILTVRQALRKALREALKGDNVAFWVHTLRRRTDLSTTGEEDNIFSSRLHEDWVSRNQWDEQYTNELYISVLMEGDRYSMFDPATFVSSLLPNKFIAKTLRQIEEREGELNLLVGRILKRLKAYGARRLGTRVIQGEEFSEIGEFLSKLLNLAPEPMPMAEVDMSELLPSHAILFGNNLIKVQGETGQHYAALFTIKEYHEVSTEMVDNILQLPEEFIITETFDFIDQQEVQEHFSVRYELQKIANDEELMRVSGVKELMDDDAKDPKHRYGKHQISMMVLEDSRERLEEKMRMFVRAFRDLGIAVVREDIFMEEIYWSQLPGNFPFLKRLTPLRLKHVGGYASLYNFPAGKLHGNRWGDAVTVFRTAHGTPYFFNFHYEDNGHTFIVGPYGAGKTVLMNFLISEAMKIHPKLFFFDQQRGSEIFLRAIGGQYQRLRLVGDRKKRLRFNPLQLADSPENRAFLQSWLTLLITDGNEVLEARYLNDDVRHRLAQLVDHAMNLPVAKRQLSEVIEAFFPLRGKTRSPAELEEEAMRRVMQGLSADASDETLEERLSAWVAEGTYAALFDNAADDWQLDEGRVFGLDMTEMVEARRPVAPLMFYLLHRIEEQLDGSPCLVVLDEAWALIDNAMFRTRLHDWLARMRAKNAVVIFATESIQKAEQSPLTQALSDEIETKIFLPNPAASPEGYAHVFGLRPEEFAMLSGMESARRQFLLKHNVDAVVAELNLAGMTDALATLAAKTETLAMMEGVMLDAGQDVANWYPVFCRRLQGEELP